MKRKWEIIVPLLGDTMEKRLGTSGFRLRVGFLGLLLLLGVGDCLAKSSFKNTPLYKHIARRRNTEPVKLYEAEPVTVAKQQAEVVEKSSDEKPEVGKKGRLAKAAKGGGLEKSRTAYVARRSADSLMDPSTFTPDMPLSEAIDILRNSTPRKLNIVVLWKDLEENADIYPDTTIGIDGVSGVPFSRHLRSLVDGVSGGSPEKLGYVVDEGVVVIATAGSLPQKMVTRVYDVTDLMGQPAQYGGMQGIMMNRMAGMMGGGMMPGFGGGYGNFGGRFGMGSGLINTPFR